MKRGMAGSRLAGFMPLSDLQQRVAAIVFALDESEGFALAGGGALIAHDVVDRTTRDLDCFGPSRDAVDRYWPAIVGALQEAGFAVEVRVADHGFAKMIVSDAVAGDVTQVDVGFDPAGMPAVAMLFGRVRAIDDLAADKLLALFGRAAPRDFVDVQALRRRFTRRELEAFATAKDRGFNLTVLRDAFGVPGSLPRSQFEVGDDTFAEMTTEFESGRAELDR